MSVRAADGSQTLLKHALPVPRRQRPAPGGSHEAAPAPVRQLRNFNCALPAKSRGKGFSENSTEHVERYGMKAQGKSSCELGIIF